VKSDTFNWKRFLRLIRMDLTLNAGWISSGTAVLFCLMTAGCLIDGFLTGDKPRAPYYYAFLLFLGGLILTSLSFAETADRRKMHGFLLLPCSTLEKYLSRYVLTSWLVVAAGVGFYSFFIFLARGAYALIDGQPFVFSVFFTRVQMWILLGYLIVHPIFLAGAVFFKKQPFLITVAAIYALTFVLMCFISLLKHVLYWNTIFLPVSSTTAFNPLEGYHWDLLGIAFLWARWPSVVLPPLIFLIGYIRLKETESIDGI
jgi:hypothetical protein